MLKRLIPVNFKDALKVLIGAAQAVPAGVRQSNGPDDRLLPGPARFCPVCRQTTEFAPLPYEILLNHARHQCPYHLWDAETLNLSEYWCRKCLATDRDRLFALYLEREWNREQNTDRTLLEIAPHASLTAFLRRLPHATIRTADLCDPGADDRVDIMDMSLYSTGQFDAWICSHVLEHVPDDRRAMRELSRILKPGGWGIVMVPLYRSTVATHEDPSITDPALRWKHFGQDDHVRVYAKDDFVARLHAA